MYARKTFLIIGSTVVTQFLGFVSLFFVTNRIEQGEFGLVALTISLLSIFGIVIDLGFSSAHIKRVSEGLDIGRCIGTYAMIKAVLLMIYIPFALLGVHIYSLYSDVDQRVLFILLSWSILATLSSILTNTYMGRQEMVKAQTVVVVSTLLQTAATIMVVLRTNDVYLYAATWIVGGGSALLLGLIMMNGLSIKRPTKEYIVSYARYALPMMFVIGAAPIILQLNPVMIGFFNSKDDVALFTVAVKYATAPEFISTALITVLFPAFSMMTASGMMDQIKRLTRNAERYLAMVIVFPTMFAMAVATPFLVIFTQPAYAPAGIMMAYLMAWVLVKSLTKPYLVHFGGLDKPIYSSILSMITLPLGIVLNLIFIPGSIMGVPLLGLGPRGAAMAALLGALVSYAIVRFLSYKLIPMGVNVSVLKHLLAGGAMSASIYSLEHFVHPMTRWYDLFLFATIGAGIYLTLIYAMGELRRADVRFFLDTLNVRKMYGYITEELMGRG